LLFPFQHHYNALQLFYSFFNCRFASLTLCFSLYPFFCDLFWPLYTAIGVDASASIIFLRRISSLTFSHFPCPSSFSFYCLFPSPYPIDFYLLVLAVALCCLLREFLIPQHFPEALTGFHSRLSCRALLQLSSKPSFQEFRSFLYIPNACFVSPGTHF